MAFSVHVTERSELDIRTAISFIFLDSPESASRWYHELRLAMELLGTFPKKFVKIPEHTRFEVEIRHCMHYSHRIVYMVDNKTETVRVLRLYHSAGRPLSKRQILESDTLISARQIKNGKSTAVTNVDDILNEDQNKSY